MIEYHCSKCGHKSENKKAFQKKSNVSNIFSVYSYSCPSCSYTMSPKTVVIDVHRCPNCSYLTDSIDEFQNRTNITDSIASMSWGCPNCSYSGRPITIDGRSIESNLDYIKKYESILAQIEHLPCFEKLLSYDEIKQLPNILLEDEKLEKLASGYYKVGFGIIAATNQRIIFVGNSAAYQLIVEDFPYDQINSIQYNIGGGIFRGAIEIFACGNWAHIQWVEEDLGKDFAEHARKKINEMKSSPPVTAPAPAPPQDFITQLERLAKLKESGILTEQEFNEEKKKILDSREK